MSSTPAVSLPDQRAIANKALILLGSSKKVANLSEADGADATDLLTLWDIARRALLAMHPWNFALTRELLQRDAAAPTGAEFAFALPPLCLRWLPWSRDDAYWFDAVEEGGKLLTRDAGPIVARYIRDVPEAARWAPLFVELFAYQLAVEYCEGKAKLRGLQDWLTGQRDERLATAKRVDGLASPNRPRGPSAATSRWAGARFRPNGATSRWR